MIKPKKKEEGRVTFVANEAGGRRTVPPHHQKTPLDGGRSPDEGAQEGGEEEI